MHSLSPGIYTSQKFGAISCSGKALHTALGAEFHHFGQTFESVPTSVEHGRLCNEQHLQHLHRLVIDEVDYAFCHVRVILTHLVGLSAFLENAGGIMW